MVDLDSPVWGQLCWEHLWATSGEPITLPKTPYCVTARGQCRPETQGPAGRAHEGGAGGRGQPLSLRSGSARPCLELRSPAAEHGCSKPGPWPPGHIPAPPPPPAAPGEACPPGRAARWSGNPSGGSPPPAPGLSRRGPPGPGPTLSSLHTWWESPACARRLAVPHHSCRTPAESEEACLSRLPSTVLWVGSPAVSRWGPRQGHSRCPRLPPTPLATPRPCQALKHRGNEDIRSGPLVGLWRVSLPTSTPELQAQRPECVCSRPSAAQPARRLGHPGEPGLGAWGGPRPPAPSRRATVGGSCGSCPGCGATDQASSSRRARRKSPPGWFFCAPKQLYEGAVQSHNPPPTECSGGAVSIADFV